MQVSHEAIFQYIDVLPRGERKHRRAQKRSDAAEIRGKIANMHSIEEPPAEVDELKVPVIWRLTTQITSAFMVP